MIALWAFGVAEKKKKKRLRDILRQSEASGRKARTLLPLLFFFLHSGGRSWAFLEASPFFFFSRRELELIIPWPDLMGFLCSYPPLHLLLYIPAAMFSTHTYRPSDSSYSLSPERKETCFYNTV